MLPRASNRIRIFLAVSLGVVSLATNGLAQATRVDLRGLLSGAGLTDSELTALDNREVVVKSIVTKDKQEIATLGVVKIKDLPAVSMNTFRESLSQKGAEALKAGGKFSDPPGLDDLRSLELDDESFEQLRACEVERCDIHLTADMIRRFQTEVDWNAHDHRGVVTRLFIETLVGRVRDYASAGNGGLGRHENRPEAIDLRASHNKLLADSLFLEELAPEFVRYLRDFPRVELPLVESGFYWSVIDFGLKPSVTLSHSVAYEKREPSGSQMFVASKQIYSSRYVDASLTMSMLLRIPAGDRLETYMIVTDRSRSDALEGPLGSLARRLVRNEAEERLRNLVSKVELRLIAATRPATPVETAEPGVTERLVDQVGSPVGLSLLALVLVAGLFFVLRRKRE